MPRILGVDIPSNKRISYAIRYIYGIGPTLASDLIDKAGIDPSIKADKLTDEEITKLAQLLQTHYNTEGDLRREVTQNIRRLISINCYRGLRHKRSLPVRGQRTSTNARTRKGPRKTVGAIRGKEARSAAKATAKKA